MLSPRPRASRLQVTGRRCSDEMNNDISNAIYKRERAVVFHVGNEVQSLWYSTD